jgi:hypothetical protein
MERRTSFALDELTIQRMKRLARTWRVSQAEVVRRAIEQALADDERGRNALLTRLDAYHQRNGVNAAAADRYLEEVAENRAEWGRDS